MITQLYSFQTIGLSSTKITVEVGTRRGEAKTHIVGLGDTAVQESKQRVWMALRSAGMHVSTCTVTTINLAPANIRKSGPRYDLPIALGILLSHGTFTLTPEQAATSAFIGELALDGSLRHVSGVLSAAIACKEYGITTLVVPAVNAAEAKIISGLTVIGVHTIQQVVEYYMNDTMPFVSDAPEQIQCPPDTVVNFADVRGQSMAKRALEIAAAGGHNVLLSGTPGSGKTLLARAFQGILPPLTQAESIEVTQIYSVANRLPENVSLIQKRPFRPVHHTASGVSIVGGGREPGPGEISLAHRGVLFLDELAEFPAQVLEVLRQPLEDRTITISRTQGTVTFPADFILVAAMNPSRFSSGGKGAAKKISAPLLDRIDLAIDVQPVTITELQTTVTTKSESSEQIKNRVVQARAMQTTRFAHWPMETNKEMSVKAIDTLCLLDEESKQLLQKAVQSLGLSARGYHRTIKVARTIADLDACESIALRHIAEALQYRQRIEV